MKLKRAPIRNKVSKKRFKDIERKGSKKHITLTDTKGDFIFRFDLSTNRHPPPIYDEPIVEMVREQICYLLDVVVLTSAGKEVKIDGFKFLNNLNLNYELFKKNKTNLKFKKISNHKNRALRRQKSEEV